MSYRNDHDAALARIDALEAELGKTATLDAKARFAAMEQQLAQAKAERDRMREKLDDAQPRSYGVPLLLTACALAVAGGIGLAVRTHNVHVDAAPPAPVAAAKVAPLSPAGVLMNCVAEIDRIAANGLSIGAPCLAAIKTQSDDPTLGPDVHETLQAWLATENDIVANRDTGARARRDAMLPTIHAVVRHDFTR